MVEIRLEVMDWFIIDSSLCPLLNTVRGGRRNRIIVQDGSFLSFSHGGASKDKLENCGNSDHGGCDTDIELTVRNYTDSREIISGNPAFIR
jgi:hypothetical protein